MDDFLEVNAPLTLAVSSTRCWSCDTPMEVAGLIASNINQLPDAVICLEAATELPDDLIEFIQARVPNYRLGHSRAGGDYFANHCPSCGAIAGDHSLFDEPGGAFWPETVEDAVAVLLEPYPMIAPIRVVSGYGEGLAEFILEHGSPK